MTGKVELFFFVAFRFALQFRVFNSFLFDALLFFIPPTPESTIILTAVNTSFMMCHGVSNHCVIVMYIKMYILCYQGY